MRGHPTFFYFFALCYLVFTNPGWYCTIQGHERSPLLLKAKSDLTPSEWWGTTGKFSDSFRVCEVVWVSTKWAYNFHSKTDVRNPNWYSTSEDTFNNQLRKLTDSSRVGEVNWFSTIRAYQIRIRDNQICIRMPTKKKAPSAEKVLRERMKKVKQLMAKREKDRLSKARRRNAILGCNTDGDVEPHGADVVRNCLLAFESECNSMTHGFCIACRMSGLSIVPNKNGYCKKCAKRSVKDIFHDRNALPLWYNDAGVAQYRVPPELSDLTYAEKILIQRVSPFVALSHIVNGTFGITGHVCAFEQDIEGFAQCLPRLSTDATIIKVVRSMRKEIGGNKEAVSKTYKVRKKNVISALEFLQHHHADYRNVVIKESNLDWMNGSEDYLKCTEIEGNELESRNDATTDESGKCGSEEREGSNDDVEWNNLDGEEPEEIAAQRVNLNEDLGPSVSQTLGRADGDNIAEFGYVDEGGSAPLSAEDQEINRILREASRTSPKAKDVAMIWPSQEQVPVDEYGETRLFVNAFPWLFPGGIGDVKDHPGNEGKVIWLGTISGRTTNLTFAILLSGMGENDSVLRRWKIYEGSNIWVLCVKLHNSSPELVMRSLVCRQVPKEPGQ